MSEKIIKGIESGDLRLDMNGFNSTQATIYPETPKGKEILGGALSVNYWKSSLLEMDKKYKSGAVKHKDGLVSFG